MSRDEGADITSQPRDLLDHSRTEISVGVFWHHEDGLDAFIQAAVHEGKLELKLKVTYRPQSTDNCLRPNALRIINQKAIKGIHLNTRPLAHRVPDKTKPLLQRKRGLFGFIVRNRHDYFVKEFHGSLDDIQVTIGQWIKASRANTDAHNAIVGSFVGADESEMRICAGYPTAFCPEG